MSSPRLAVIVVTWNSASVIRDCLVSLRRAVADRQVEIVVVDNASRDATLSIVEVEAPDALVIRNASNRGLARAINQGILATSGDPILICNPDVVFGPDSVDLMARVLEGQPQAGWVVPRLTYEDGSVQTSTGDLPVLRDALLGRQSARRRGDGFWWDGIDHRVAEPIGRGHEAAYIVRREAVETVGLVDARYRLDWEGIDWTERFRRAGWQIWIEPAARVVHLGGDSIRQVPYRWIALQHRGMYLYFSDRKPLYWKPFLAVAFGTRAVVKALLVLFGVSLYERAHRKKGVRGEGSASGGRT